MWPHATTPRSETTSVRFAAPVVAAACIRGDTIARLAEEVAPGQAGRLAEEVKDRDIDGAEHAQMCTRR
jgi:hypothetical protein